MSSSSRSLLSGRRFTTFMVVALVVAFMAVSLTAAMSVDAELDATPHKSASKSSGSKKSTTSTSSSHGASSSSSSASSGGGSKSRSAILAERKAAADKLRSLGTVAKIRDAHTRFDASLAKARETLNNIQTLEAGGKGDRLNIGNGKQTSAIRYVQRTRAKVALLNARHATVANPSPFSATSSIAMRTPAQYKKMTSTRRSKKVKVPVRRFGQKPLVYPTKGAKDAKAQSKVAALKDKVTSAAAAAGGKSKSVSIAKNPKKKSLLQLRSSQTPHSGAGGIVGKSGKTGGGSGTDASKSGKTGGDSGGDSGKSGKTGGTDGGDSSKSGKTGGASGGNASGTPPAATDADNAKCNQVTPGAITYWSATAAGQKVYKNTPGYKASPGDMVMADGHIYNQGAPPPANQFNPRTGKCFTPIVTVGAGGVLYPGRCPTCVQGTNPAIGPGGKPWDPISIHYDENDQICYGNNCPPSVDANGGLLNPFNPVILNGVFQSMNAPSLQIGGGAPRMYARNQGDGSWCWANSAVQLAELAQQLPHKDAQGNTIAPTFRAPLSVATVVKCVANQGDNGGSPIDALEWMKTHVLPTDNLKPSDAIICPPAVPLGQGTIDSYVTPIPTCDHGDCSGQKQYEDELLKQTSAMPILVYVDASQWQTYKPPPAGVPINWDALMFPTTACSNNPDLGNHVVFLIGTINIKATGKTYWVLLNSWGDSWGAGNYKNFGGPGTTGGYIYLEYGVNACGLANYPVGVDMA